MIQLIMQHQFWSAVIAYWLFSAAVSSMDEPKGPGFYSWLFRFLHTVAGNLTTAFGDKLKAAIKPPIVSILIMILTFAALSACHGIQLHPGAPDQASSQAYDSLLAAKAVIDTTKAALKAGTLDASFKPFVNDASASYNVGVTALNAYVDAVNKNQPADVALQNLTLDIAALNNKILSLKGVVQ